MFVFSVDNDCKMCGEEIDRLQMMYDERFKDLGGAIILPKGVRFISNINPSQTTYAYDDPNDYFDDDDDDGFENNNDNVD